VQQIASALYSWGARLDKVWVGEGIVAPGGRAPPMLMGRARPGCLDLEGVNAGEWLLVVFESLEQPDFEGPFLSMEEAIEHAVRDWSIEAWRRLFDADAYHGLSPLRASDAPDHTLRAYASARYAPDRPPDADWMLRTDDDRISAIRLFHRGHDGRHPLGRDGWRHAFSHLLAESALAAGQDDAFREAFEAWLAAGLTRHEAIHALAECISGQLEDASKGQADEIEEYLSAICVDLYRGTAD